MQQIKCIVQGKIRSKGVLLCKLHLVAAFAATGAGDVSFNN